MSYATAYKAAAASTDLTPAGWPAGWGFPGFASVASSPPLPPGYDKFPGVTISSGTGRLSSTAALSALGSIDITRTSPGAVLESLADDFMYFDGNVVDLTEYEYVEIPVDAALNFVDPQDDYPDDLSEQIFTVEGATTDFDVTSMPSAPTVANRQNATPNLEALQGQNYYFLTDKFLVDIPQTAAAYGLKFAVRSTSISNDPAGTYGFNWDTAGSVILHAANPNTVASTVFGTISSAAPTTYVASARADISASQYLVCKFASTVTNYDGYKAFRCPMTLDSGTGKVYAKWITSAIDVTTLTWNNQPTLGSAFELYQNFAAGDYIPLPADPSADIYGIMIYCDSDLVVDTRDSTFRLV
jgi:hypothetical protein